MRAAHHIDLHIRDLNEIFEISRALHDGVEDLLGNSGNETSELLVVYAGALAMRK